MTQVSTPALILHGFPYGDTSKILRLLTPEYGLRSVIAKGAYGPRSRFGALLEPFTEGEAQFNLREGHELFILTGFSLSRSRQALGRDLTAFSGASLLAEVALRFGTEETNLELFDLLVGGLNRLADPQWSPAGVTIPTLWSLISLLGYRPEMERCVRCGRHIETGVTAAFDVVAGGVVCQSCGSGLPMLDPTIRREVYNMSADSEPARMVADFPGHGALLRLFLGVHLAQDRPLRSLPLFLEQLE